MTLKAIPGMKDLLPPDSTQWAAVEKRARAHFFLYGYQEIRMPLLEETQLFVRGIGEGTGVVQKEMYTFLDKGGDSVTLRPEGTASVVRSFIENSLDKKEPLHKFYYIGPMFRYERPQKGRLRQFHQIGCEVLGTRSADADVEMIVMLHDLVSDLGVSGFKLEINSLGCAENADCRPKFLTMVKEYFTAHATGLCEDCQKRLETNPLRIFDCKKEPCRAIASKAPVVSDNLCGDCAPHFAHVKQGLQDLRVDFTHNPRIVRGLDYYDKTAFELTSDKLGSQSAFAGGGRYNNLVSSMGGPSVPAVGFAIGLERLMMLVSPESLPAEKPTIFLACLGEPARRKGRELVRILRTAGVSAEMDYDDKSLKSQMKRADKLGCQFAGILGDAELEKGLVMVRNLATREQVEVTDLLAHFKKL